MALTEKEKTANTQRNAQALEELLLPVEYDSEGSKVSLSPSIVKKYIANDKNITDVEYKFFVELCKARSLNPFLKEVYLIKYSDNAPAQIVVGKDAILKRAVRNPQFNGREQGIIVQTEKGELINRKGTFYLKEEKVVGGWATVYRKDWEHPVEVTVSIEEAEQKKSSGDVNTNWANKKATMIEKVALVRALREAFVEETGGMIERDEAWDEKNLNVQKQDDPFDKGGRTVIDAETGELSPHDFMDGKKKSKKLSIDDV